jgi:hypothetical protein
MRAEEMGYAPTYYPGTSDLGRGVAIEVKSGEELTGLDINLILLTRFGCGDAS